MERKENRCLFCNKVLIGRSNKRYCNRTCADRFNKGFKHQEVRQCAYEYCNETITGTLQKRFCSASCRSRHHYGTKPVEVICQWCGKACTGIYNTKRFCNRNCAQKSLDAKAKGINCKSEMKCRWCSNQLEIIGQIWCSKECKARAYRSRGTDRTPEDYDPQLLDCRFCGEVFQTNRSQQKYCCTNCRHSAQGGRRRAKKLETVIEPICYAEIRERDGMICQICGLPVDEYLKHPDHFSLSFDHAVPLSKGGTHTNDNLQVSHLICNLLKSDQYPYTREEHLPRLDAYF